MSEFDDNTRSFGRVFSDLIVFLSFAAIAISMVMTVGDILLRLVAQGVQTFSGVRPKWGLFGLVDLTQLAIMTAVPLAIAVTFFRNTHIRIDLLFDRMSGSWKQASALLSALIGLSLMGICLWTAWKEMRGQLDFTTTSATLSIPYTWYWAPLIAGFALSFLACFVAIILVLKKAPLEGLENEHV